MVPDAHGGTTLWHFRATESWVRDEVTSFLVNDGVDAVDVEIDG